MEPAYSDECLSGEGDEHSLLGSEMDTDMVGPTCKHCLALLDMNHLTLSR